MPLADFARTYRLGEKLIAADMVSTTNDKFYGQWHDLDALVPREISERVPSKHKFLPSALHWRPGLWTNEKAIYEFMELQAHKGPFIETVISMIRATAFLIDAYLRGDLRTVPDANLYEEDPFAQWDELQFNAKQKLLEDNIRRRVKQSLDARNATTDAEAERIIALAQEHGSMIFGSGSAGCGKTAVIDMCIQWARTSSTRPPRASSRRGCANDTRTSRSTFHAALGLHLSVHQTIGRMMDFDLVVIDEAPQLVADHFTHIREMWFAAEKLPCVVFAGDVWQLPPPDAVQQSIVEHPAWKFVYRVDLHEIFWQAQSDPLTQKLAVLRKTHLFGDDGNYFVAELCQGRKGWSQHHTPMACDIDTLYSAPSGRAGSSTSSRRRSFPETGTDGRWTPCRWITR